MDLPKYSEKERVEVEVKRLYERGAMVKNGAEQTMNSADMIYDHISQLTATSEEVAASSNEGLIAKSI